MCGEVKTLLAHPVWDSLSCVFCPKLLNTHMQRRAQQTCGPRLIVPYARRYAGVRGEGVLEMGTGAHLFGARANILADCRIICAKAARALSADCWSSTFMMEHIEVLLLLSRSTKIRPLNSDEGPLTMCQNVCLSTVSRRYRCCKLRLIANCTRCTHVQLSSFGLVLSSGNLRRRPKRVPHQSKR